MWSRTTSWASQLPGFGHRISAQKWDLLALGTSVLVPFLLVSRFDALELSLMFVIVFLGLPLIILTFVRIEWGLAALTFVAYTNAADVAIEHGVPSPAKIYGITLLIAATLHIIRGYKPIGAGTPALITLIYMLLILASLSYSDYFRDAREPVINYIREGMICILMILTLRTGAMFKLLIWSLIIAALFLGSMNLLQFITGAYWFNFAGFANAEYDELAKELGDYRISGPLADPNFYALILLPIVPLCIERLLNEPMRFLRPVAAVTLATVLLAISLTYSRGALIGLVGMLGVALIRIRIPPKALALGLVVMLCVLPFTPNAYITRINDMIATIAGDKAASETSAADVSVDGRLAEMQVAWRMFTDNPLFGVGAGSYIFNFQSYSQDLHLINRGEDRNAHNLYLQIAAERGLIGLAAFGTLLWFMAQSLRRSKHMFQEAGCYDYGTLATAFSTGLVGFLISSFFLHDSYPKYFWILIGITLSLPQAAQWEIARFRRRSLSLQPSLNN
ncbi:O-antigen ligase family protein [Methylocaldum sp.]|uniref:O-antigen ligase family protein n=1 Tax=Methylocaldum sp. TaxID=1969727 RepID=UPI002D78D48F|nr:O-antigen ligase family protein [Methylocaldum sp.]